MRYRGFIAATFLSCLFASLGQAQFSIIATDRGWYDEFGDHDPANVNYFAGDGRGPDCRCSAGDVRNFVAFDLTGLGGTILNATLVLGVPDATHPGYSSDDGFEDYEVVDVTTSIADLLSGTGGLQTWADLGSGVKYGGARATAADQGSSIRIPLNAAAIASMNGATGLYALGGHITSLDGASNDEYTFGFSHFLPLSSTQLEINMSPWTDLGCALAGTPGDPALLGTGPLTAGSANQLDLSNALPGSTAILFASALSAPVPFRGGMLKANPPTVVLLLPTGGGSLSLPFIQPGLPPGSSFFVQFGIVDGGAIQGVALSNAIQGTAQ